MGQVRLDGFISIHVNKCGGTTFGNMLRKMYGEDLYWDPSEDPIGLHGPVQLVKARRFSHFKAIHGHFHSSKYAALKRPFITWVRNPVTRLESEYAVVVGQDGYKCGSPFQEHVKHGRVSFREYMTMTRNVFTNFFGHLELKDFAFVGVLEYWKESMRVFSKLTGKRIPIVKKANVRNPKKYFARGTDRERELVKKLNEDDMRFYDRAVERLLGGGYDK